MTSETRSGSQRSLVENPLTKILEQRFLALPGANVQVDVVGTSRAIILQELEAISKLPVREPDDLLLADVATLALTLHQPAIVIENEPVPEEKGAKPGTRPLPTLPLKLKIGHIEAMLVALKDLKSLKPVTDALAEIQVAYIQFMEKFANASAEVRQQMLVPRPEVTGDCIGFYHIDHAVALELMCRDKFGFTRKQNLYGNHAVVAKGGLHFKPNPKALDFLGPAEEYAVHSFGENLLSITNRWDNFVPSGSSIATSGSGNMSGLLTAPTMLIKISNVEITRISKKKSPPEHYRAFTDAIVSGKSAEQVLADPEIGKNVVKVRRLASSVIQVGLTIEGILLMHVLELVQFFETCKLQMSNEAFKAAVTGFRGDCYRSELFKDYPHFNKGPETNKYQLLEVFLGFSAMHQSKIRLYDFQELDGPDQRRIHRFNKLMALSVENIVTALAIIKKWPMLMEGRYLSDIARIPSMFALLNKLFPTKTTDQIIEEVPLLLKKIEPFNFTASFVMTLLLHPEDAKADNFMVEIVPDQQGNVRWLRIVGIDNDRAFKPAIKQNKVGNFFTGIKSVLLCLPNVSDTIDGRFRTEFLKQPPEVLLVNWLRELNDQNKRYARLEMIGALTDKDKYEKGSQKMAKSLDIPIRLPTAVLLRMYDKLRAMHRLLFREATITHIDLFQRIEPLVHFYYQHFRQKYPLDMINAIYHGDWIPIPLESVASGSAANPTGAPAGAVRNPLVKSPEGQNQDSNEPLEYSIQTFLRSVDMRECSASAAQSILSTVSSNFPEVTRMEVTQSQLDSFLEISLRRPELDVPLVTMLLKLGADPRLAMPKGGSLVALLLQRRPLPVSLLRRVCGMAALSQDIEKNSFPIGQVLLEVMAAATRGSPEGAVSIRDADAVFDMLLRAGLDLDAVAGEPPAEQETLLDRAVRLDLPHAFALLVLRGASRCMRLSETMPFAERYSSSSNTNEALRRDMTDAIRLLLRANPSFSWELSLRLLKVPKGTENSLTITAFLDGSSAEASLRPDVSVKILSLLSVDSYTHVHQTHFGQSVFASWTNIYPLLELSLVKFQKRVFGQSHLQMDLCRVAEKPNKVLVLSNHLEAVSMRNCLADEGLKRGLSQNLDMRTYSELVLTHALLAQAATIDDLYVCVSASSIAPPSLAKGTSTTASKWPILLRSNTPQLHGSALRRRGGELILAVRNYLYCMDEMRQPIDPATRKTILRLKPGKVIGLWLNELLALQEKAEETFKGVGGATFLFMPCAHEVISTELHERLSHLQDILASEDASIALLDVLFRMNSIVGLAYHSVHRLIRLPEERYQYLCSTPLDKVLEENLQLVPELELQLPLRQALTLVSASDHRSHTRCDLKHAILCSNRYQKTS